MNILECKESRRAMQSVWPLFSGGYIPGLHVTQGVFMKLFRLLEATCHQFDLQLAYTYQEKSSSSTKYAEELHKLQVAKAKLAEVQDSLAALEEAVMYVVVAYGEDSPVRISLSGMPWTGGSLWR